MDMPRRPDISSSLPLASLTSLLVSGVLSCLVVQALISEGFSDFYPARSDTDMPSSPMLMSSAKSNAVTIM